MQNLLAAGIEKIVIGTGYLCEHYQEFSKKYPQVVTVHSANYKNTSSMETLFVMRDQLCEDFLLLESDLLYESGAIGYLINDPDVILASGTTHSNDEVYIQVDAHGGLEQMSKHPAELSSIYGELVGISAISFDTYQRMCKIYSMQDNKKIDYEYILVSASKEKSLNVKKVNDLIWCEIDDSQHLLRAQQMVFPKIKARSVLIKRNVLLNPGPATTTDTVKMAQVVPDICPREKEFGNLMRFVSDELTSIVADPDTHACVLFGGSGTAAVEAMLTSVVPKDKIVVIINNGSYGKRMCQMAARYKMNFIEFNSSPVEPVDFFALELLLQSRSDISHIALVHNETTTGLLNDLDAIGALAGKYNVQLMLDAMISYAAIPIDMVKQHVDYLAASSNKNIQGVAGVSFVIASKAVLKDLISVEPRGFYLSLYEQYRGFYDTSQMRFTPPVQVLYALKQAVIEAKAEGIEARYARYVDCWSILTGKLKEIGLSYLVSDDHHSKIITSIYIPQGVDFDNMHDYFYLKDLLFYPGKVEGVFL